MQNNYNCKLLNCFYFVKGFADVEKHVPAIGWVKNSELQKKCLDPQLFIVPQDSSSFFTSL